MKKIKFTKLNLKNTLKTILFMLYIYGLVIVTPYLFDSFLSVDLFTWLKPVICVILGAIIYDPLLGKISDILELDDEKDK